MNLQKDKREWLTINVSASKICNKSNHTKIAVDQKKLLLPCCYQWYSIESTKWWMGVMMFYGIYETMNGSDEVWRLVQKKYVMIRIIQKMQPLKKNEDIGK